jgi:hypothetical protein
LTTALAHLVYVPCNIPFLERNAKVDKLTQKLRKQRAKRRTGSAPKKDAPPQQPHGTRDIELFGHTVRVPDDRPRRSLQARDLIEPDKAPPYLKEEIDAIAKKAEESNVDMGSLSLTQAEYLLKGYFQFVHKQQTDEAA